MRECPNDEMRDLLPHLASGALTGEARLRAESHVASCAGCAAELELLRAARAAMARVPRMDVGRIAAALPAPPVAARPALRVERGGVTSAPAHQARAARRRTPLMRIAAGIVAVATLGGIGVREAIRGRYVEPTPTATAPTSASGATGVAARPGVVPAPAREGASPVAKPATRASGRAQLGIAGVTGDLNDESLRALLDEIDDLNALPSAEPDAELPGVQEG